MNYLPWHLVRPHLSLRHWGLYPTSWPRSTLQWCSWYSHSHIFGGLQCTPRSYVPPPASVGSTLPVACQQNLTRSDSSILGLNRLIQSWQLPVPATMPRRRNKGQRQSKKGAGREVALTSSRDKPTDENESASLRDKRTDEKETTSSRDKPTDEKELTSPRDKPTDETESKKRQQAGSSSKDMDQTGYKKVKFEHHRHDDSRHATGHGECTWLKRQWLSIGNGFRSDHPKGLNFSVMSYNVLAQGLLEEHRDMYDHCDSRFLSWEYRRKQLIDEIKFFHPDVICMQEVQGDHYDDFFAPMMKQLGYQGVYKKRTNDKIDGCATFFNERKFALDIVLPVEYYYSQDPILDRDNVGLVVLLKLVPQLNVSARKQSQNKTVGMSKAKLCVANTHLLFNPRRGDVKLAQLCLLLAEIDKIAAKSDFLGYHPVILCGDFNFCPLSPLFNFTVGKSLNLKDFSGKDLSGQKESLRGGPLPMSPDNLPPRVVEISDQCQYIDEVARRRPERNAAIAKNESKKDDGRGTCGHKLESTSMANNNSNMNLYSLGTGVLSNNLKLVSVYRHNTQREDGRWYPVVTTKHGRSESNVDFMFYSVENNLQHEKAYKKRKYNKFIEEGHLKLLSKLDLYTLNEARLIGGFPSKYYPSDHIPLIAHFRLCF